MKVASWKPCVHGVLSVRERSFWKTSFSLLSPYRTMRSGMMLDMVLSWEPLAWSCYLTGKGQVVYVLFTGRLGDL